MNATNRNNGTKQVMEATSSRNPLSLEEGGEGGQLPAGSGRNNRNNNTEHENENTKAATTAVPSSSSPGKEDGGGSIGTTTKKKKHASLSSSPILSSSVTTVGILTENGPCHNNTNETAAAAATPSPSSATKTMSEVVAAELAAAESRCEREECPICFHVLPHRINEIEYKFCCGRTICLGCIIGRQRAELKETGKIVEGVTPEEIQFMLIARRWSNVCPFCRHAGVETDEEELQLLYDRIKKQHERDYTKALITLGVLYCKGSLGLPQNIEKGVELLQEAYKLDNPIAALKLAAYYSAQYPNQKEKWMEFLRRGETLGNIRCMEILAKNLIDADNYKEATRLLMKAASLGGDTPSLMICYEHKMLSKADFATTLRNQQAAKDEIKTVQREFAKRYKAFDERN